MKTIRPDDVKHGCAHVLSTLYIGIIRPVGIISKIILQINESIYQLLL